MKLDIPLSVKDGDRLRVILRGALQTDRASITMADTVMVLDESGEPVSGAASAVCMQRGRLESS